LKIIRFSKTVKARDFFRARPDALAQRASEPNPGLKVPKTGLSKPGFGLKRGLATIPAQNWLFKSQFWTQNCPILGKSSLFLGICPGKVTIFPNRLTGRKDDFRYENHLFVL